MRRNGHNTTSGIKSDHAIRPACPKTYMYIKKSWLKTRFCGYFSRMSNFCLFFAIGDFLRMRVKPEVVVRFYCPTNLSSNLVPNHHAKFGDDRLRIADARVVTDGHTHRTWTCILLVLYLLHAMHCITMLEKRNESGDVYL